MVNEQYYSINSLVMENSLAESESILKCSNPYILKELLIKKSPVVVWTCQAQSKSCNADYIGPR